MKNTIPAKARVRCKFEVHFTLSVPIEDMYASDRAIIEKLCGQYIFDQRDQDEDGNPTYGLDPEFLRERGIEVVSALCSSDPRPTGRQHISHDWEIEVDEEEAMRNHMGNDLSPDTEERVGKYYLECNVVNEFTMASLNVILNSLQFEVCKKRSLANDPHGHFYLNDYGSAFDNAYTDAFGTPWECLKRYEHYVDNRYRNKIVKLDDYMSIFGLFAYENWKQHPRAMDIQLSFDDFRAYDRKHYGVPS